MKPTSTPSRHDRDRNIENQPSIAICCWPTRLLGLSPRCRQRARILGSRSGLEGPYHCAPPTEPTIHHDDMRRKFPGRSYMQAYHHWSDALFPCSLGCAAGRAISSKVKDCTMLHANKCHHTILIQKHKSIVRQSRQNPSMKDLRKTISLFQGRTSWNRASPLQTDLGLWLRHR